MTLTTSTPASIPGYSLDPPSEAGARGALDRVFGAERGAERWREACRAAGVRPGAVNSPAALLRAVEALSAQGGATAMVARSIEIRLRTYTRLASAAAGGSR